MRAFAVLLALLAAAAPAAAQTVKPLGGPYVDLQRDLDARTVAGRQTAKEHDTALRNELTTLQASEQTRELLADIAAKTARPAMPTFDPRHPPRADKLQFAQIPDAALAASNARAVAASENRR